MKTNNTENQQGRANDGKANDGGGGASEIGIFERRVYPDIKHSRRREPSDFICNLDKSESIADFVWPPVYLLRFPTFNF